MNILFLTDYWFPNLTANSVCVKNISENLLISGHSVFVCAYIGDGAKSELDGINFSYVKPSISRRLLTFSSKTINPFLSAFCVSLGKTINRLRTVFLLPFYPISSLSMPFRWRLAVDKIIIKHKIDIVVSVNAPQESLYAGFLVKKKYPDIKWIVYNIDSGTNILNGVSFERIKKLLQNYAQRNENRLLNCSDRIIVMEGHYHYYKKILSCKNLLKLYYANVPLYRENSEITEYIAKSENIEKERWVYTGNICGEIYDPVAICTLFIEYRKTSKAELHFYGPTTHGAYLSNISKKHPYINWHGSVPHDKIDEIQSNATVLVYYKNKELDSISGKFFEYLSKGKPIIYLGPKNDINAKQLCKYNMGISLDISESNLHNANLVRKFLSSTCNKENINSQDLKNIYHLSLPSTTARLISSVCDAKELGCLNGDAERNA